ncbi:late control D family protein [Chelativorans sp. ZYF759]|uniref:phage late control D family protein n=1 Tax=Chelativorans sp. ZYF759 TaxID=2692213 RepID=UPI00145D9C7E|nr:late control D family protein [Chelativorans sp. ZYF759]NMG39790.1 late control D family protein [Chelativorans sp. ZYF759]
MPWKVNWQVFIDGRDMSSVMAPFLMDIDVTDKDGTSSDTCSLRFDDAGGQVLLPPDGAKVRVLLQGVQVFFGTVDTVRSSGSRGRGMVLQVSAKGMDSRGRIKEPQAFHKDDASLEEFLQTAAERAGLAGVRVLGRLGAIRRGYWAADGESFLHLGQRLARELAATFKIRATDAGDMAVLAPREHDEPLPVVEGVVGRNVISWDIAPYTGRRVFTSARARWFDRESATFREREVTFALDRDLPESVNVLRSTVHDEDQAEEAGAARKAEAEREGGEGSVELDLVPEAQAEGSFVLTGARPAVDGTYRIASVTHRASRNGGSTTSLDIKRPQGGAGKDDRG